MEPRYQVFISSTFRDLEKERQAVLAAVLELGHFPAGMEAFPAASATPWDLIKKIISESDYYVLIIGARYGSTDEKGVSYTEREYDLACELEIPTLIFLHGAPDSIPAGKVEMDSHAQNRLTAFRAKVERHHCKSWKSPDELSTNVLLGLIHEIRVNPRVGWIRANQRETSESLLKLNLLLEENARFKNELETLRQANNFNQSDEHKYAHDSELKEITAYPDIKGTGFYKVALTWSHIFRVTARFMMAGARSSELMHLLAILVMTKAKDRDTRSSEFPEATLQLRDWDDIVLQFLALDYREAVAIPIFQTDYYGGASRSDSAGYRLTRLGLKRFAEIAAVPVGAGA